MKGSDIGSLSGEVEVVRMKNIKSLLIACYSVPSMRCNIIKETVFSEKLYYSD